jgi:nitronate monooxygenase
MFEPRSLESPIVGAPMAGGPSTPELAAAVSAAGGLGFLAAGYKSAGQLAAQIQRARELTSAPVGVNLFVVEPVEPDPAALQAYRVALEPEAQRLGVTLGTPRWDDDGWAGKLEVVLDLQPEVVSFTFACPDADVLGRLTAAGITTMVTVTTAAEARIAEARGARALSVQGPGAGGHRATFDQSATPTQAPLGSTVEEIVAGTGLPVVAGGGIATAGEVAGLLSRGAVAAQVGTALLLADEAGTNALHREALTGGRFTSTTPTRAFTGRLARGLTNRFITAHPDAPVGYPHLHHLTAPVRAAAVAQHDADTAHLWAGTGFPAIHGGPAATVVDALTP